MNLDFLLSLEDEYNLWIPEVCNIKLWVCVRTIVLDAVINEYLGYNAETRGKGTRWAFLSLQLLPKHLRTLKFAISDSGLPQYSAVFFKTGRPDGIYQYFYDRLANPLIVESSWRGVISEEVWASDTPIILGDTFTKQAQVRARTQSLSNAENQTITEFSNLLCRVFSLKPHWASYLFKQIVKQVKYANNLRPLVVKQILPRLKNKFAFVHQASYLGGNGLIVNILHEMNYVVAEVQHGIVHQWHWAYHYPQSVLVNDIHSGRRYLPDLFLTFGDYWANQTRLPSRSIVIGFPELSEAVRRSASANAAQSPQILIISQGTLTEKMVAITTDLARKFTDYHIIFKLHPLEIGFVERYQALEQLPNVEIKGKENIHGLITQSTIIVGEGSTVMFEACAFPGKRLFILRNDLITLPIGAMFGTSEELIALIEDSTKGCPQYPLEMIWAPDWEARITRFLREYIPLSEKSAL